MRWPRIFRPRHRWRRDPKWQIDPRHMEWFCEACGEQALDDTRQAVDTWFPCYPRADAVPADVPDGKGSEVIA